MITILTGRQTDPMQEKILEAAINSYKQHPERKTFIIIPNHIKFTTEVRAINKLANVNQQEEASTSNLQVLSFSRLAWYFLKDQEQGLQPVLDDAACSMIIAQILQEENDHLTLLKNNTNTGVWKQIYQTILKIQNSNLPLADIASANLDPETAGKIHDLKIIYQDFMQKISGRFVTKDEIELQLNSALAEEKDLNKMDFFFCDFSHFSLQEILTIQLLFLHAHNVTLAFKTQNGSIQKKEKGDYDFVVQQTIAKLIKFLQTRNLSYQTRKIPLPQKMTAADKLNAQWSKLSFSHDDDAIRSVQLVAADSRYSEAYFAVRTIYQQVALKKYRYRDFLILAPNLHEYETYLLPILRQNNIPYFDDLQQEMKYHPLVILIENLAELINNPLNTSSILAIMKTQLLIPDFYRDVDSYRHDVDELENFVLAHGINHHLWKKECREFTQAQSIKLDQLAEEIGKIDKLRNFFVNKLSNLLAKLEQEKDPQRAVSIFFDFLVKMGVPQVLEQWRQKAIADNDLQKAQQPEQLWQLLLQLLQDYLLLVKNSFSPSDFFQMLVSAFQEATFSQIPASLDAVNLSETGMVQTDNYAQVFILGASSSALPQIKKEPSFLTPENISALSQFSTADSYLEDEQELNNLSQKYQFGNILALANERVYLSYPVLDAANERLTPSIYFNDLKAMGAPVFAQHDLPAKKSDILSFMTNAHASMSYLAYLQSSANSPESQELINLASEKEAKEKQDLQNALAFSADPVDIGPKLAQKLYGKQLETSVSQLETFYANSEEYFLTYGLKLHKRATNQLDLIQAGNYFHESLDHLLKAAQRQKINLSQLSGPELLKLLQKVQKQILLKDNYQQLRNDSFNQYLFSRLEKTTARLAQHWQSNMQKSKLEPIYSELAFGPGQDLSGLDFKLDQDREVKLRGKIDRVDLLNTETQVLGQVIDYKSSAKNFDLSMFFNGLNLQMLSYLDILAQHPEFFSKQADLKLVGGFYQTVTAKLNKLNAKSSISASLKVKGDQEDSLNRLEYTGLINNDPNILLAADPELNGPSENSTIYSGVRKRKNGNLTLPRNRNFSDKELQLLLAFDEYLIKKAAENILAGKINLNPYRLDSQKTALTYSDFKDIFFFDIKLGVNRYHNISNMTKAELMTKIKEILRGNN